MARASGSSRSAARARQLPRIGARLRDAGNPLFTADDGLQVRVPLKAGLRQVIVTDREVRRGQSRGARTGSHSDLDHDTTATSARRSSISSLLIGGPYNGQVPQDSPSRRRIFVCHPDRHARRNARARRRFCRRWRGVRIAGRRRTTTSRRCSASIKTRPSRRQTSTPASAPRSSGCSSAPTSCSASRPIPANVAPGTAYRLSDVELASRLSFFLWSSIPDDELLDLAIRGKLRDAQGARSAGAAHARRSARARRRSCDNFFGQWLQTRNVWLLTPDANRKFPWFDDNLRTAFVRETELFLDEPAEGGPQHRRPADGGLHVPQRAARASLRDFRRLRQPLPPGDARRREPLGPARQGERPGGDVVPAPHLADDSRQVAAREHSRRAGAAAASRREHHSRRGQDRSRPTSVREMLEQHRANPGVRQLPRAHGSARLQPRELRCDRPVAHDGRRVRRSTRPACCWTAPRSTARRRSARALVAQKEQFVKAVTGKLLTYAHRPRDGILTTRRRSARSCARRPPTTTAGRRRFWRSSRARRFR